MKQGLLMCEAQPEISYLTMRRLLCFGPCPSYRIHVTAEGAVFFDGHAFVIQEGKHNWQLSSSRMGALAKIVDRSHFFTAKHPKGEPLPDSATIALKIKMADGRFRGIEPMCGWQMLDRIAFRIEKYCRVHEFGYRPLCEYQLSIEDKGDTYCHSVHATDVKEAQLLIAEELPGLVAGVERARDPKAWKAKFIGVSEYLFPGFGGVTNGRIAKE